MKLTTRGRYAVMAVVDIACQGQDRPVPLVDIALRQAISISYLEQLFGKLRKGKQVKSVRGPRGGYLLARDPEHMKIAEIILAVDEPIKATRCSNDSMSGCAHDGARCLTHDLWSELSNHIILFLSSVSLADVVNNRVSPAGKKSLLCSDSLQLNDDQCTEEKVWGG